MDILTFAVLAMVAVGVATWLCLYASPVGELGDYSEYVVPGSESIGEGPLTITSLGGTTMLVDDGETKILIDAFLTPVSMSAAALSVVVPGRKVSSKPAVLQSMLEEAGALDAVAVFVSHSHHDHVFDVAAIAQLTGATVYGSESTLNVARGGEIAEDRLKPLALGHAQILDNIAVTPLQSRHSKNPIGREGTKIEEELAQPASIRDYKEGGTFDFLVEAKGCRILFKGSAHWAESALDDVKADVVFLAVAGIGKAKSTFVQEFFDHTIGATEPRLVIPTHWNDLFAPVASPLPLQPRFVDHTPHAFDRLLARRGTPPAFEVRILDALASVRVGALRTTGRADPPLSPPGATSPDH